MRASVLNDLGILYKQRGENELSLQYIRHSLEVSGYGIRYIHTRYLNIGELYLRMGQKDSALYYLERCLADANTRTAACASLSKLYSRIGAWKTACTYQNCYIAYIDSVYQNHKAAELAMQSEHYDKEKAIAIMQQQNLKSRFVLFLIVGIIIMILLVILLIVSKKSKSKAVDLLKASQIIASFKRDYVDAQEQKILLENNYRTVCEKLKSLKENEAQRQGQYTKLERQKKDLEEQLAGYKKEIEDQLEKEKQSLKLQLVSKEEEVVHLKKQIEQMENLEKNVEILRQYILKQSSLYNQIIPLVGKKHTVKDHKVKIAAEDWQIFFTQMDTAFSGFASKLEAKYHLKDEYLGLACLIFLNVKPCNLQIVYNISLSGISNKRKSLAVILDVSIDDLDNYLRTKVI